MHMYIQVGMTQHDIIYRCTVADPGFSKRGFFYMQAAAKGSRTEVCSADQSAGSVDQSVLIRVGFQLSGPVGSHGTFVLCAASSRCKSIAGPGAAMCFRFLLKFRSCNVIRTYS